MAVFNHSLTRPLFTWSNHQSEGFLLRKLDKVLINDIWLHSFTYSTIKFTPSRASDHCHTLVQVFKPHTSPPKPFKVFNF